MANTLIERINELTRERIDIWRYNSLINRELERNLWNNLVKFNSGCLTGLWKFDDGEECILGVPERPTLLSEGTISYARRIGLGSLSHINCEVHAIEDRRNNLTYVFVLPSRAYLDR